MDDIYFNEGCKFPGTLYADFLEQALAAPQQPTDPVRRSSPHISPVGPPEQEKPSLDNQLD